MLLVKRFAKILVLCYMKMLVRFTHEIENINDKRHTSLVNTTLVGKFYAGVYAYWLMKQKLW